MKIYINDKEIEEDYSSFSFSEITNKINSSLEGKIIEKIFLNEIEINQSYLNELPIEKDNIKSIKYVTNNIDNLILETLEQIDSYLPNLKSGCLEASNFYRNGDFSKANDKYQLLLDGLSWYIDSTYKILSLIDLYKLNKKFDDYLLTFNEYLNELENAQKNDDDILVADILEYEVIDFIDKFIMLNDRIKDNFKKESDL